VEGRPMTVMFDAGNDDEGQRESRENQLISFSANGVRKCDGYSAIPRGQRRLIFPPQRSFRE